ncbi:MAG: Ig-like domain-containing protein [Bacteroides sp.]|nr:Ig-like domain-containing protein [Eubacterium sp.]MCM1418103.1 Ig-like domain-containing protein [Roseburia sp.]MCM1462273.1 Ig-like domain-containing protein [Bacteroides sp.]
MKKFSLRLAALLISAGILSSCFSSPSGVDETTETSETTGQAVAAFDPETGEPIRLLPAETAVISLEPQSLNGELVRTDSTFRVKTREDLAESELSALLTVRPEREVHITKNGACDYTLDLGTLPKGEVVKVMLGDGKGNTVDSWGFETEDEFRVLSTLPADLSRYVPPESGIELSLSRQADLAKVGDYIEISPSVSGSFTNYSTTLVFVPSEPMQNNTVYTVRVKAGLPSADGDALGDEMTFSFRTAEGDDDNYCYAINGISESYLPDDPVVIDVYANAWFAKQEFDRKLYRYPDATAYREAIEDYNAATDWDGEYLIPTEGLELISDGKEPLYQYEANDNGYYTYPNRKKSFVLSERLEEGHYLVDLSTELDGRVYRVQRLIQISSLSVYSAVLSGQAIFFLNDTDTGEAAASAEVTLSVGGADFGGEADAEGIAVLDYSAPSERLVVTEETGYGSAEARYGVVEIRYGDRVYCDRMLCVPDRELTPEEKYYMYLFTDREAYLTTDTVRFWGVILPRDDRFDVPTDLTVKLGRSTNDGFSTEVTVEADGTFLGEIAIDGYGDSWYEPLTMFDGETELYCKYMMIRDYEKPIYLMTPDLPEIVWLPQENGLEAGVSLTYYDGTPAVDKVINIDDWLAPPTDETGYTSRTLTTDSGTTYYSESPSRPWENHYIGFRLTGVEDRYIAAYDDVLCFIRDVDLETKSTRAEDGSTTIDFSGYAVELGENIKFDDYGYPLEDTYRGDPTDLTVDVRVRRRWSEKREIGSYYDFIQKKNFPTYQYIDREEYVGHYTVELKDGKATLADLPTTDPDSWYYVEMTWTDRGGRPMSDSIFLSGNMVYYYNMTDYITYSLDVESDAGRWYNTKIGETRKFVLENNDGLVSEDDFTGRLLYMVNQDRFLSIDTTDKSSFEIEMEETYIPSYSVSAAYFDGRHIFPVNDVFMRFNEEDREIDLTIETDRASYAPAETAEVTLTAKTTDGRAISNARILLSVVDEAAFAIAPQRADILSRIYLAVYYRDPLTYTSYLQHTMFDDINGDGGGGGGDDSVRRKFVDTAYFAEGFSDASGRLTLAVELPDNVTSWRFTAVAVASLDGGRIYAGDEMINVSATLPLFITPTMVDEYVEGDDIVFAAPCAGDPNAVVTAEVSGADFNKTLDADADGEFNFGKLPVGDYTVLFRAEGERGSDAAEYPFTVVSARLTSRIERELLLDGSNELSPAVWPITLNFYNRDTALYAEILNDLLCLSGSNLDYRLAREYASVERGWSDGSTLSRTVREETSNTVSGGVRLYPYTEGDAELTALVCMAFPEYVNRAALIYMLDEELKGQYDRSEDEMISYYLALAALERPVLNETRRLLAEKTGLTAGEKLKLCAAVALLGDRDTALKYYLETTDDLALYQKDGEVFAYFTSDGSDDSDKIQGDTRLALLAASVLNLPEAESMAWWLNRERHREYGCALERVVFLKYYTPALNLSATLGYTANGEEKTEEVNSFYGLSLTFGEEQFKNAVFKAVDGNIGCTAIYEGKTNELEGEPTLKLTKTLTLDEGEAGQPGAVYRVSLEIEGDGRYFTIEDMIPSNARFLEGVTVSDGVKFVAFENDDGRQDVTISLGGIKKASYTFRLVTKGETVLESSVVRNEKGDFGVAEEGILK